MKALKVLGITLAVVVALASLGWFLRDSLIRRISNPILEDYDIEVVNVSIDALSTRAATISFLELVHAKGTTIVIEGLSLPVNTDEDQVKVYSAGKVSIVTATRDDDAPFEMARLVDQFLTLTDALPNTKILVDEFRLAPYPVVRDLAWSLSEREQTLGGTVGSVDMSMSTSRVDVGTYLIDFSLPDGGNSGDPPDVVGGRLIQSELGISITGDPILDLPGWQAITRLVGIVPDNVEVRSGTGKLNFAVTIPYDVTQTPNVAAVLAATSPLQIGYLGDSGTSTDLRITKSSPVEIAATFPDVEWSIRQSLMSLTVSDGDWHDVPLELSEMSCQTGPDCSMQASIAWSDAATPFGTAKQVAMTSSIKLSFPDDGLRIDIRPDAVLELMELRAADNDLARAQARLASAAIMQYRPYGWEFETDSIDANVESLSLTDDLLITAPVYVENLSASERGGTIAVSAGVFVPSTQAAFEELAFATPGFRGEVSLQNETISFDLATVGMFSDGTIKGQHSIESGIGEMAFVNTALTFNGAALSKRVSPWRKEWDISDGNITVDLQTNWGPEVPGHDLRVNSSLGIAGLSGYYADIVFADLSSSIRFDYNDETGFAVDPTTIRIALIDMGLPIENISANVMLDANNLSVAVSNLQMTAFNGLISAEPFSFHTGNDVNTVTLTAKGLDLAEVLATNEFEAVEISGTIGAVLPITIEPDGISIDAGSLTGESPGGLIRYLAGDDADGPDTSAIGLATTALSNFAYESLTSNVTYSKDGNLILQMQLKGRNPKMADSRPVVLNLGVENNVIQMLKSLQAARAVEEILEKQLAE